MAILLEDYQSKVISLLTEGERLLRDMNQTPLGEEVASQIGTFQKKDKPSIMFYGLYNAGKSTLINALCRETVAKVGDIPTTASIQGIPYQGYQLIDTPGIDAKQDHTEIARKEILQSDLILFVVDNADGFERQVVYKSIIEIVKMEKPVAVVINQKNINDAEDVDLDVPELPSMQRTVAKVASNLHKQGIMENCDLLQEKKYFLGYFPVNAQICLDALECDSQTDKETLYASSGVYSLIHAMDQSISETANVLRLRTPLIHLKEKLQEGFLCYSDTDIFGEKAIVVKERNILTESKQRNYDRLMTEGYLTIESCFENVRRIGAAGGNYDGITEQLQKDLSHLLEESGAKEHQFLCRQLSTLKDFDHGVSSTTTDGVPDNELSSVLSTLGDLSYVAPTVIASIPNSLPLMKIMEIALTFFEKLITGRKNSNSGDEARARESEERLGAYYKWQNDLRDSESKIKLDFQTAVDKFSEQIYGQRLEILDKTLEEMNDTCAEYARHQKEQEELNKSVTLLLQKLAIESL